MSRTAAKKKTKSKQLRDVFYRLWEQDDEGYKIFDDYYDSKMKKIVEHYKKLIE